MKHSKKTFSKAILGAIAVLVLVIVTYSFSTIPNAPPVDRKTINILAAVSLRPYLEDLTKALEPNGYFHLECHYGASEDLLTRIGFQPENNPIDIYIPADESYVHKAEKLGYVQKTWPLARMNAVVLIAEGNNTIQDWPTLLQEPRISLANENAAIGQLTREHLKKSGEWAKLEPLLVGTTNVSESANAVKIGAVPAAIVWEPVAKNYPNLSRLELPELRGIEAKIVAASLNDRDNPKMFLMSLAIPALLEKHYFTPLADR
jgi:molybdate transport system substrate-binding protein